MKYLILILVSLTVIPLSSQTTTNWDSVYQVSESSIELVYENIDEAAVFTDSLFHAYSKDAPDSVLFSLWKNKVTVDFYQGYFDKATQSAIELFKIAERRNDSIQIFEAIVISATINYYTDAYDKAISELKQAIDFISSKKIAKEEFASPFNTLGAIYNSLGEKDSAIHYYKQALNYLQDSSSYLFNEMHAIISGNIGALYLLKEEYDRSIYNLNLALKFNKKINRISGLSFSSLKLSEAYLNQGLFDSASYYLHMSDSLSKLSSTMELRKDNKAMLLKYYLLKNYGNDGLLILEDYNRLIDSTITEKTKTSIQEAKTKYETEKKEAALVLEKEKASRLQVESENRQLIIWVFGAILFIALVIFLMVYRSIINKRKLAQMELRIKENQLDEMMANQESKAYSAMLKGQEEERERIAQDLHDRLGGTLAALKLALKRPDNKVSDEDLAVVDEAVNEVRSIAHNLSTGLLKKYGLAEALQQLKLTIEKTGKLSLNIYLNSSIATLGQSRTIELYRIVQELLNNTLKHADATQVSIQTNQDGAAFNLIYEDNGSGFDQSEKSGGIGLENIKKRVKKLKGTLHIDSELGRGSIFIIELNL